MNTLLAFLFGAFILLFYIYIVLSIEFGLCFVTGKGYKGKLLSLRKKDIELRRKHFVKAIKEDHYSMRPGFFSFIWRLITLNAFAVGMSVSIVATALVNSFTDPNLIDLESSNFAYFIPTFLFVFWRVLRPLGALRPYWMGKYVKQLESREK